MKNSFVIILFTFCSVVLNAQQIADKFTLTPAGFSESVLREYPGKTDSKLFEGAKMWAINAIDNTEDAITREITDRYLEYQVFAPQAFSIKDNGTVYTWDAMFDLAFRFEDERIRYDVEIVEVSSPDAPAFQIVGGPNDWAFYTLDNEPIPLTSDARKVMEDIVNDFIRGVSAYINRDADIPEKDN